MLRRAASALRRRLSHSAWAAIAKVAWRPSTSEGSIRLLRDEVRDLAPLSGCDWWTQARLELRRQLREEDPRRFLTWPVVERTLVEREWRYIAAELRELEAIDLREDPLGCPRPFPYEPRSSGTLISHAYLIRRFERQAGLRVRDLESVVEFGGGFGSMARLFRRYGFMGPYHIHDFPELGALQRFYLSNVCGLEGFSFSFSRSEAPAADLFIATDSLSEAPLRAREPWKSFAREAPYGLLCYADAFRGIDNTAWFTNLKRDPSAWTEESLPRKPRLSLLVKRPAQAKVQQAVI